MRGRDYLGEFEYVVLLAVLRLRDQPMALPCGARLRRERSGKFPSAPSTPLSIVWLLSPLFGPGAPQLWMVTPLASIPVSLAVNVLLPFLLESSSECVGQVKQVGFGLHDPQHDEPN